MTHIIEKDLFHAQGKILVINKRVDLEIMLKAAEIHIGRADGSDVIITDDQFGMQLMINLECKNPGR